MDIKRFFVYAIVSAALALAGCSSDGNGGMTDTPPDLGPTPEERIETAQMGAAEAATAAGIAQADAAEAATAARQAAMDAAGLDHADDMNVAAAIKDAEEAAMAAEEAKTAADEAKAAADEAKAAADAATDAEAAEMAAMNAETAQADAESAQADAESAQADAEMALGTARTASMAVQTGIDVAAATKAAATKLTAIQKEAAQSENAGLGGTDDDDTDGTYNTTYSLAIERDASATKVTITDTAMADDDDPKFEQRMDLGTANGFAGSMHVRENGEGVEEVVIVRTDIAAPKATPFAMVAGQELNADATGTTQTVGDPDAVAFIPFPTAITAGTSDVDELAVLANIKSSAFQAGVGESNSHTFDGTDAEGNNGTDGFETAGTYNGAEGTYKCVGGSDCSVSVNADGEVTGFSTGWIFTPDPGATSDVPDASYLAYGFWLKRTTANGATTYDEVEAFTGGTIAVTNAANVETVVGTATYTGNSTGVYVKNVTDDQNNIISATSGHYSAAVDLEASFGGGGIGVNDQFRIDGTVEDFVLSNGEENDWAVELESTDFSGRAADALAGPAGTSYANTFAGTTTGDSSADKGSWSGGFYGEAAETPDPGDGTARIAPAHVMGEFNANFTDGAVLGAFGATKPE
ncbi:MAG: hypothetical protein F4153_00945 [Acidimicrobiia bacterium]|nr:hypothetical protein [Acidimicrobiia bacterium]